MKTIQGTHFDLGLSWSEVARYKSLNFQKAGTFKLCWCDSERLQHEVNFL